VTAPLSLTFIPESIGNPYFEAVTEGLKSGCNALDCDFTSVGPAIMEAQSQVPFVNEQIQHGTSIIAIAPNSPTALNELFDKARRGGALVLTVSSDIPGHETHRDAAILPLDFSQVGAAQVELMGSLIDYQGQVAILSTTAQATDQAEWIADMRRILSSNVKYSRMKLVVAAYGADDPGKSKAQTEKILDKFPNVRGIIAPTVVGLAAAAQVLQASGKARQVKLTGLGMPRQMRHFVANGMVTAFQLWNPYLLGVLAAHFSVGVKRGTIRNVPGKTFQVPGFEKLLVRERSVVYVQSRLTTFDRSNIDRFNF